VPAWFFIAHSYISENGVESSNFSQPFFHLCVNWVTICISTYSPVCNKSALLESFYNYGTAFFSYAILLSLCAAKLMQADFPTPRAKMLDEADIFLPHTSSGILRGLPECVA